MNTHLQPSAVSIERLVPSELSVSDDTGAETLRIHMERYQFASRFARQGRVLDCACGVGYGTHFLAAEGDAELLGVDIDQAAINYAQANYVADQVRFLCGDAATLTEGPFDTIVSLETIEHVPDPDKLIDNFGRLLKPGGTLVASVPVTPSTDVNPYHLHDFTSRSFRKLFTGRGFREVDHLAQRQPYNPLRIATGNEERLSDMRQNLIGYYLRNPSAALMRLRTTVMDGFCNKYLTCAWTR